MQFGTPIEPSGSPTRMTAVEYLGRANLVELSDAKATGYSMSGVNSLPIAVEIQYGTAAATVRNWSLGEEIIDLMYPDQQTRIDEHFMNHLANVMHVPNVIENFATASRILDAGSVSLDGREIPADIYDWEGLHGLIFADGDLAISCVSNRDESHLSFQHVVGID